MVVSVSTGRLADDILDEIHQVSTSQTSLTPRSIQKLRELNRDGDVLAAFVSGELAGWGLREPLGGSWFELGMLYVKPKFRALDVFLKLCPALVQKPGGYVFATYDKHLRRYALERWDFVDSSIWAVALRTRGRFITKRLDAQSRKSVSQKMKNSKPLILIRAAK